ncbi:hypothetical protein [Bacteroides cellulosilyticus]|jgi:hypothetical protein|uniref:hypothetical protein n=1 Tax=Bacteroides cellulosilyticus TaxID=246787 RepID=UPI0022E18A06|nr:hypothetical protein [Bacteroides cellulosilyticus]
MMRKYLLPLLLLFVWIVPLSGQTYMKINYDTRTTAAMVSEYTAAAVAEGYYDEQVKDILAKYGVAEVAAAGIFTSKYMDRKALTNLGIWSNGTENHYYRRIYRLVSVKIIPMMWNLSGQLLRYPHKSLYWGSYLIKICAEVKSLCMQFEAIVTNGTLSFKDIQFLELDPRFAAFMQFSKFGGTDWETLIDDFSSINKNFTLENLAGDIGTLYELGTQLATSGFENMSGDIMGNSEFEGSFKDKAFAAADIVKNVYDIYKDSDGQVANLFQQYLGENPTAADLFSFSSYNLTGWIDDYLNEVGGTYYTQRWWIGRVESGSETVAEYNPPTDDNSVIKGPHWVRFDTSDASFYPNSRQLEQVLSNSERHAGWSRSRIEQLNAKNDGYTYRMSKSLLAYKITKGDRQTKKAYAYRIVITRSWYLSEEVYEEHFDSFRMDLATFKMKMQALLNEYNDNEEGKVYQLKYGSKNYYQAADDAKLKGCENVIISMTCTDNVTLGEGSTQYKCRQCSGSLNEHSKACSMQTTASESGQLDLSEFNRLELEYRGQIAILQTDIAALEADNRRLADLIRNATETVAAGYKQQMNANTELINGKRKQIEMIEKQLEELRHAKAEAETDNVPSTDEYYRLPAIMEDCRTAYRLTWQGDGWWSGYTYYRYATASDIKGTVTFSANLTIARKPQYFLGIKIHRAILKISWQLSATYSDTQVVENISLEPDMADAEKKKLVNERLAELAMEYPKCQLSTEYVKSDPFEEDVTDDSYHLLWASDRLAIARQVESRLMKIYADLVSLQKMMNYKLTIIDVLKNIAPYVNTEDGRKQTLAEECRKRWLRNAAKKHHSIHYNGKYDDESEERR